MSVLLFTLQKINYLRQKNCLQEKLNRYHEKRLHFMNRTAMLSMYGSKPCDDPEVQKSVYNTVFKDKIKNSELFRKYYTEKYPTEKSDNDEKAQEKALDEMLEDIEFQNKNSEAWNEMVEAARYESYGVLSDETFLTSMTNAAKMEAFAIKMEDNTIEYEIKILEPKLAAITQQIQAIERAEQQEIQQGTVKFGLG